MAQLDQWLRDGRQVALATVIETWGTTPRGAGAAMAVTADGERLGSV
ncbi:MAG: XdhC family protein, partial [Anaerolineae bacterium]